MEAKLITPKIAQNIIRNRTTKGRFFFRTGNFWIGIDNSTEDAWIGEFHSFKSCILWLFNGIYLLRTIHDLEPVTFTYKVQELYVLILKDIDWNQERVKGIDVKTGQKREIGIDEIISVEID